MKVSRYRLFNQQHPVIRAYTQKLKKGISSKSSSQKVQDVESNDVKDLTFDVDLGGDAESSQDDWTSRFTDIPDTHHPDREFLSFISESQSEISHYSQFKSSFKALSAKQSLQHVSVPEMMMLISFLQGDFPNGYVKVCLKPFIHSRVNTLASRYEIEYGKDLFKRFSLAFHTKKLALSIRYQRQRVGFLNYYLHQGRLEEIKGRYQGHSVNLDPVWVFQKDKPYVSYERLKIGDFSTDLIRDSKTKHGRWKKKYNHQWVMKVSAIASARIDSKTFVTRKYWQCGPYHVQTRLLYCSSFLMPLLMRSLVYSSSKTETSFIS